MKERMTVAIVGYGQSGKDTLAQMFRSVSTLRYEGSTSWFGLPHMAKVLNLAPQIAWDTRHQMRDKWKRELDVYRAGNPTRLVREVLAVADVVSGVRDSVEMRAALEEGLFDHVLWVDRGVMRDHTVTFGLECCTEVIENFGDVHKLRRKAEKWARVHNVWRGANQAAA